MIECVAAALSRASAAFLRYSSALELKTLSRIESRENSTIPAWFHERLPGSVQICKQSVRRSVISSVVPTAGSAIAGYNRENASGGGSVDRALLLQHNQPAG